MIEGKDSRYNCFLISNKLGRRGVGVLLAEKWVDKVFDVNDHQNDCSKVVFTVFLVYAPQTGLTIAEKELFFWQPTKPCPNYWWFGDAFNLQWFQ